MSEASITRRGTRLLTSTTALLGRALSRRDGRTVAFLALVGYPLVYWVALGHLGVAGQNGGGVDLLVVADPLARMLKARSPYSYEPIARLVAGPVVWLVSPVNIGLGLGLGALVAANAAVGLVSWRAPGVCSASARTGPFAGVLALLGGATCCGPAIFFLLGVQATGALVGAFSVLVPLSVTLLVGTLLLAGRGVAPG